MMVVEVRGDRDIKVFGLKVIGLFYRVVISCFLRPRKRPGPRRALQSLESNDVPFRAKKCPIKSAITASCQATRAVEDGYYCIHTWSTRT